MTDYRDGFPYPQVTKALRYEAEMVVALAKGGNDIDQPPFSPMGSANLRFPGPFLQKQIHSGREIEEPQKNEANREYQTRIMLRLMNGMSKFKHL